MIRSYLQNMITARDGCDIRSAYTFSFIFFLSFSCVDQNVLQHWKVINYLGRSVRQRKLACCFCFTFLDSMPFYFWKRQTSISTPAYWYRSRAYTVSQTEIRETVNNPLIFITVKCISNSQTNVVSLQKSFLVQ